MLMCCSKQATYFMNNFVWNHEEIESANKLKKEEWDEGGNKTFSNNTEEQPDQSD